MILRFATLQTLELVHLLVQELMRNAGDQWKKNEDPHKLHLEINDNKISEAVCTCKVG